MAIDPNMTIDAGSAALGGIIGFAAAAFVLFAVLMLILLIAIYIYTSLATMAIAKKTKTKNAWLAWIPIANVYLLTQMAKVSGLWTLMLLAYFLPYVGALTVIGFSTWFYWRIAKRIGFPGWTSLLMIIPIVNFVILGLYAWSKAK